MPASGTKYGLAIQTRSRAFRIPGEVRLADRLVLRVRPGVNDLHERVPGWFLELRKVIAAVNRLIGREVPVFEKDPLQPFDRRPFDAKVRVAPLAEFRMHAEVLVADVEPAGEANAAVHDEYLAVVAQVHPEPIERIEDRKKRRHAPFAPVSCCNSRDATDCTIQPSRTETAPRPRGWHTRTGRR